MKIACIAHLSEVSGSGVALLGIVHGLQHEGFSVSLLLPGNGPLAARARGEGVESAIIENPERSFENGIVQKSILLAQRAKYVLKLAAFLKRQRFDLIYVNSSASVFPGVAALIAREPIVWHIHETPNRNSRSVRVKCCIIRSLSNGFLYASRSGMEALPQPPGKPGMIVRNPIDTTALLPLGEQRVSGHRTAKPTCTILMNGTSHAKGVDLFFQALALAGGKSAAAFDVAVAGADVNGAKNTYDQLYHDNPAIRVNFTGLVPSLAPLLAQSDVFISPSRNEAMPIAIVEAMAAGVPVIATDVGDCAELLGMGERGWVVPAESPQAIAHALTEVLEHPDEAARRARAAFEFVRETYATPDFWKPLAQFLRALQK